MSVPAVSDPDWQIWLARFPAIFPEAYDAPATFKRRVDRASLDALPPLARLSAAERGAVLRWLDEINVAILRPASARTWARTATAFGVTVAGACATIAAAPIAVPAALLGIVVGGWGFLDIAVSEASKDSAEVVSQRLIAIMRLL